MKKIIEGFLYILGDNVDTDQIIPARHLSYNPAIQEERKFFGKYALSGVPPLQTGLPQGNIPFVQEGAWRSLYSIILAGKNFGCGSSREHAPIALQVAGIEAVIAEFYARIFFRNAVNGGYLIPFESGEATAALRETLKTGERVTLDVPEHKLIHHATGKTYSLNPLGEVLPILEAGNVFAYARQAGMIR